MEHHSPTLKTKLESLWNGHYPLLHTFWLYYFVIVLVLGLLARAVGGTGGMILNLLSLVWAGYMIVPIWRASDRYQGNKVFALLAKVVAVLIGLSLLLTLLRVAGG